MLQKRGISYSSAKGKRVIIDFSIPACQAEEQPPKPVAHKKPKLDKSNLTAKESTSDIKETSSESSDCSGSVPGSHQQFFFIAYCMSC